MDKMRASSLSEPANMIAFSLVMPHSSTDS